MSRPIDVEDFEEKMKEADKRIAEIKKKYEWMDMRTPEEKQREVEDLAWELCIQQDFETDYTYDPEATKFENFHPDAQREIENGIKNHALTLANMRKAYDWMVMEPTTSQEDTISDQAESPKRVSGAKVYELLLKLKKDFPDKSEKELLADAYKIMKDVSDFSFNEKKWYTGSLTGYLDKWKQNLMKYLKEGLSWEEALLRIYREERTGKERVGNEQMRDDVKWKNPEDFDGDNETGIKNFGEFKETLEDLQDSIDNLIYGLDTGVDDYIREERDKRIFKEIGDFEEKKNRTLSDEEVFKVYNHLKTIWNKQHSFNEEF